MQIYTTDISLKNTYQFALEYEFEDYPNKNQDRDDIYRSTEEDQSLYQDITLHLIDSPINPGNKPVDVKTFEIGKSPSPTSPEKLIVYAKPDETIYFDIVAEDPNEDEVLMF